jgi:hypothetical protein
MSFEQSAARRTEVGPVQTIAVGPVEAIVPTKAIVRSTDERQTNAIARAA